MKEGKVVEYIATGKVAIILNKIRRMWKVKTEIGGYESIGFCFSGGLEKK